MRRKDTTQDDLRGHVAAALLRMLEGRELSQVAVKELAAEAGVSRSTFYRLFEGKDQVVSWWYGTLMDGYVRLFAEREDHGREGYLRAIFDCFASHRDDLLLLHERGCTHLMLGVFRDRLADGRMSYASAYHIGGIYGVMEQWLDGGMAEPPERMAAEGLAIMPPDFTPAAVAKARSPH
ncbi:MAG: TetR/AcrR family transcriptional regulator [Atopobiaceae bacterium]|nr:TetR/AcrR family transcriptional regulator [Atopobiaceae bacterium]